MECCDSKCEMFKARSPVSKEEWAVKEKITYQLLYKLLISPCDSIFPLRETQIVDTMNHDFAKIQKGSSCKAISMVLASYQI